MLSINDVVNIPCFVSQFKRVAGIPLDLSFSADVLVGRFVFSDRRPPVLTKQSITLEILRSQRE